ncbi:MAG: cyclic nucleotide-binding domain-containing protein [Gemmatimonadaceae bacterium]
MTHAAPDVVATDVVRLIASAPLFAPLDERERRAVVARGSLLEMPVGGVVVAEGDRTEELYVLLSGEATVSVRLGGDGETVDVGMLRPGDAFGELGLLLGEPRTASVRAAAPCRLLRINAASFRALMETQPRFAMAMCTELARRLRTATAERNDLYTRQTPVAALSDRPEISQTASYMTHYYATAIRGVLRRHQLIVDGRFPRYEDRFQFTPEEQARWFALFDVQGAEAATPFTYFTTSATTALMRIVEDLGVNFRHLLHLRSEMQLDPHGRVLTPGEPYRCAYQLRDVVRLRDDRVAVVVRSDVSDAEGRLMVSQKDFFIVMNLPPESVAALKRSRTLGKHDPKQLVAMGKRSPTLAPRRDAGDESVSVATLPIREDMGVAYGRVSGDMNLVHTSNIGARLFGYRRPFVQGLCTANYILKTLTGATGRPPARFVIGFARPVPVGSTVTLYFTPDAFEAYDAKGNVAAFGDWEAASAIASRRSVSLAALTGE